MKKQVPISVCMSMYNAAPYLKACIDSILSQTFEHFELLIVDDESTDESVEIVHSYHDPRIRLIRNKHDYIGSLNLLMDEAKGKYIVRMDADDVMLEHRLEQQFLYMENHPEVDIMGGAMLVMGKQTEKVLPMVVGREVLPKDLLKGNYLYHPTMIFRKSSFDRQALRYEAAFRYTEDYRLWVEALKKGLRMVCTEDAFIKYRINDTQVSHVHHKTQEKLAKEIKKDLQQWLSEQQPTHSYKNTRHHREENLLTAIIPFLNEGSEVVETVKSIRAHVGEAVDILVINDGSTDGFDYYGQLLPYRVSYYHRKQNKGVAVSRDFGVEKCCTPYFLLLDAHMRFYDGNWLERIVAALKKNDRQLLCCQTKCLTKKEDGTVYADKSSTIAFGAYQSLSTKSYLPDIQWNYSELRPNKREEEIAFVLGAGYATSKRYWQLLHGLKGLLHYGSDEAFLSMKVWMEGGKCTLLKDVVIGHIYRQQAPYPMTNEKIVYNSLFIAELLYPQSLRVYAHSIAAHINENVYRKALRLLRNRQHFIREERAYIRQHFSYSYKDIAHRLFRVQPEQKEFIRKHKALLPKVAALIFDKVEGDGICEGRMAAILWTFFYQRQRKPRMIQKRKLYENLSALEKHIQHKQIPLNFRYGLTGIGWALIYLQENGFEMGNIEPLLSRIDAELSLCKIGEMKDESLETGLSGLLCYVSARLRTNQVAFSAGFIEEIRLCAEKMIMTNPDVRSCFYARLIIDILEKGKDPEDIPLKLHYWTSLPTFIPQNLKYWQFNLQNGVTGATLLLMLNKEIKS